MWARASALHRHLECPAASHLPRLDRGVWARGYLTRGVICTPDLRVEPENRTAAEWGVQMHAAKAGVSEALDPWLTWVDPHRARLWPDGLGRHEVSVSYDCRTGRFSTFFSESDQARKAWYLEQPDDCVVGTADWWGHLPTGEPWIDDLKTGWQKPEVITPQTLFYLLARIRVANEEGGSWDRGRISITHWPRAKEPTEPSRDGLWRQVSLVALEAFEDELKRAWARAVGFNPAPRPGAHCMYCPSATVCDRANE